MAIRWTRSAYADMQRIHAFLHPVDPAAAARPVRAVVARVRRIPAQLRLGERLGSFDDREVRRVLVLDYEIRYEITGADITILRIFHAREDR